ncbi:MAG: hypothetical protein D6815_12590 [Candidatus Dadabacteria bacterium]|nr:MAG: hypothetical protein D6815_12590 [Candidatus Dadabacteria bacterium]
MTASDGHEEGLYDCDPAALCPSVPAAARFANGGDDSSVPPNTVRRIAAPAIDNSGRIVFYASARGNNKGRAIYKLDPGMAVPDPIALVGQPIPDQPGAVIGRPFVPLLSPNGKVAFRAVVKGGPGPKGIFLWQ